MEPTFSITNPPAGMLGVVSYDPEECKRRQPYGVDERGVQALQLADLADRVAYVAWLDSDASGYLWFREYGRASSAEEKDLARWAISVGRWSKWISSFGGSNTAQAWANAAHTLTTYMAQQKLSAAANGGLGSIASK